MKEWSNYQKAIFDVYENTEKNIIIGATAGCLGVDTLILMYDGSLKKVQDIVVGDVVMGPDSTPRNVLSTENGISQLYRINPIKGDSWVCNEEHLLTVWDNDIWGKMKRYKNSSHKTALLDYPIEKVWKRWKTPEGNVAYLHLQRVGVEFETKPLSLDPYFLGLWLADGTKGKDKCQISVGCQDVELVEYLMNFQLGSNRLIATKTKQKGECWYIDYHTKEKGSGCNELRNQLKKIVEEDRSLKIDKDFLINSRENRLKLLAGLLDGDGSLCWKKHKEGLVPGYFGITTKYFELKEAILFLCRSLGLAAYSKEIKGRIKSIGFEGDYFSITISGDLSVIPTKISRKQATQRLKNKSVLRDGFSIEKIEIGNWYGFEVNKDHRFLLGDFTITHNSSKTTCLVEMSKRTSPSKRLLFMAFNKSIAKELESRLKDGIEVATFHSKGLKLLLSSFTFKMKLVENKCFNITIKRLKLDDIFPNQQMRYHFELQEVWNQVRVNLIENYEEDIPLICIEKDIEFRERMIEDIKLIDKEWKKGMEVLRRGTGEFPIDFTDMIYLPYKMIPPEEFKKYDVVMTDELQDVNVLQKEFILNCVKRRGRFIGCGDFAQAIYSFQGASTDNFRSFQELPNTITLPLSISYRCAKKIVEEARTVFGGGIESSLTAEEGIVRQGELKEANEGDFVLCRNNLPLVQAFVYFLSMKKKVTIKGKDLGDAIVRMLEEVEDVKDIDLLLEEKLEDLKKRGIVGKGAKNHPTYVSLEEKCSIVKVLNKVWPNMGTLKQMLGEVFTENIEGIVLSTIHKSKGLEANRVFFLNQELIPSPKAITEKAKYAERCLRFVAITRAKKELIYCKI